METLVQSTAPLFSEDSHMFQKVALHKGRYGSCCANISELQRRLEQEGLSLFVWKDSPGVVYPPHSHGHDEYIVVSSGEIEFSITGTTYLMQPGDALDLPAGTVHSAVNNGSKSCVYIICS